MPDMAVTLPGLGSLEQANSRLAKIASVLVCFNHLASFIVNANHSIM